MFMYTESMAFSEAVNYKVNLPETLFGLQTAAALCSYTIWYLICVMLFVLYCLFYKSTSDWVNVACTESCKILTEYVSKVIDENVIRYYSAFHLC